MWICFTAAQRGRLTLLCSFQFILLTLREKFVNNLSISKTEKMKLFSVANLKPVLQLCYKWKPAAAAGKAADDEADDVSATKTSTVVGVDSGSRKYRCCCSRTTRRRRWGSPSRSTSSETIPMLLHYSNGTWFSNIAWSTDLKIKWHRFPTPKKA